MISPITGGWPIFRNSQPASRARTTMKTTAMNTAAVRSGSGAALTGAVAADVTLNDDARALRDPVFLESAMLPGPGDPPKPG